MVQIVAGRVNKDGTIESGSGFYVRALGNGLYIVEFDHPLTEAPTVVLTQNYRDWDDFGYNNGNALDNSVLVAVDQKGFEVLTGNSLGQQVDRNFAFIAATASTQNGGPALVWGAIPEDPGGDFHGKGFLAIRNDTGEYNVSFEPPFEDKPGDPGLHSVVVTQNYDPTDWPSTLNNEVVVAATAGEFKYITGATKGERSNRNCSFIAVGTRSSSQAPPRLTFGNVNADGTLYGAGSGDFTVARPRTGTYVITFKSAFPAYPAVLATENYPAWTGFQGPIGIPLDNALVHWMNESQAEIITGASDGSSQNRNFTFLVAG